MVFSKMIYLPDEDSYLMQEVLKKFLPKILKQKSESKILEIGAGSGILAQTLIELNTNPKRIILTDIDEKTIKNLKKNFANIKIIHSDLFEKIPPQEFDLIILNPPYLPEDEREDEESRRATTGGKNGSEIINKFLEQSKKYLNSEGKIFLLISSLTKKINWRDYKKKKIAEKKIFFEKLYVWELFLQ